MDTTEAAKALSKAKIHLMASPNATFFSVACLSLKHQWNTAIPTACTDGVSIVYNPEFFLSLDPRERIGLVLHEVLHIIFQHPARLGNRNLKKANKAMDYAINLIIENAKFKLPAIRLLDKQYAGMSWEQIYELLPDDDEPPPWEDIAPGSNAGNDLQGQIDDIIVKAVQQSRAAGDAPGSIPGDIERYYDKLTKPEIPWYRVLAATFTRLAKNDFTYKRPNKRYFPTAFLPTRRSLKLAKGAIAIDTSGSVTENQFLQFITETQHILRIQQPEQLHILQFDSRIASEDVVTSINELKQVKFTGGGGTKISPVLEWANQNKPNWLIIFTDGEFTLPDKNPKIPVIWVIHGNIPFKPPFGKVVRFTLS